MSKVKDRFKMNITVNALVEKEGKVLFMKRSDGFFKGGFWVLPAGHVDGNEPARFACIREANEEAGMNLKMDDLKPSCIMHRLAPQRECIDMFFMIENYHGNLENMEPNKCGGLKYFNINNLPEKLIDYIKVGIENSLNGKFYCEYGFTI